MPLETYDAVDEVGRVKRVRDFATAFRHLMPGVSDGNRDGSTGNGSKSEKGALELHGVKSCCLRGRFLELLGWFQVMEYPRGSLIGLLYRCSRFAL